MSEICFFFSTLNVDVHQLKATHAMPIPPPLLGNRAMICSIGPKWTCSEQAPAPSQATSSVAVLAFSPYRHSHLSLTSLLTLGTLTSLLPTTHSHLAPHSLLTLASLSPRSHFTLACDSPHSHLSLTTLSLSPHFRFTLTSLSLHSRFTLSLHS